MTLSARRAALAAVLLLPLAAPAAAQADPRPAAAPAWDARLTPSAAPAADAPRLDAAAVSPRIKGAGLMLVGAGLMYVTKQAEGGDGEEGVPFIPLLSGTMGALTFWYGVFRIAGGS